jgi:hypothetical protein
VTSAAERCAHRDLFGILFGGTIAAFFIELFTNAVALQIREVIDEKLAIQMIHLVLKTYGTNAVELAFENLAVAIFRSNTYALGAFDFVKDSGDG